MRDRQHRVAVADLVEDDGHRQGPARQAGPDEKLALQELEILAIALAVARQLRDVDDAAMGEVGDRDDGAVDVGVDGFDEVDQLGRRRDGLRLPAVDPAFGQDSAHNRPSRRAGRRALAGDERRRGEGRRGERQRGTDGRASRPVILCPLERPLSAPCSARDALRENLGRPLLPLSPYRSPDRDNSVSPRCELDTVLARTRALLSGQDLCPPHDGDAGAQGGGRDYIPVMQWTDEAIVLGARRHGKSALILEVMTPAHGRHLGLAHGGRSRAMQPVLQPGNTVQATWRAHLDEHLGAFTLEAGTLRAARFLAAPLAL